MKKSRSSITYVFAARYPFEVTDGYLPPERKTEIENCSDDGAKQSKYYAFKLLEIAFNKVYGAGLRGCNLRRNDCGKWQCDVCNFSVTHSGNVVAVAVADTPVGVDVEKIDVDRFNDRLRQRIFTDREKKFAKNMTEPERRSYANRLWTVKEAAFKCGGGQRFVASDIDTSDLASETRVLTDGNAEYYLTVAGDSVDDVSYTTIGVNLTGKF